MMSHFYLSRRQFLWTVTAALAVGLVGCDKNHKFSPLISGSLVSALGDSLTFGYGAEQSQSYPMLLAQKTGWKVDNDGVNGDTTEDILKRLQPVILKKPKLVLLGIGGNDVLKGVPSQITKNNLINIINQLKSQSITVVLIAQPYISVSALFGKASDNPIYQEVADLTDVPLLSEVWSEILSNNNLKSDQIHANPQGYAYFTDKLYQFLQNLGLCS